MSDTIRVRMYNVGFGDCFLIHVPGNRSILVDAGFHSQGKGAFSVEELVNQIIADVTEISGSARIDIVIATHRHQDHIYAFNSEKWAGVEIGEVWMPWLEDRKNPEARKLWKKQANFALKLAEARTTFNLSDQDMKDVEFILWNAGVETDGRAFAAGGNGWSNLNALDCLHEGFKSRDRSLPRFLPTTEELEYFETSALPGVGVYVLGPPRDPELIEELDPEIDGETYRALALLGLQQTGSVVTPFAEDWMVGEDENGEGLGAEEVERIRDLGLGADAVLAAEKVDSMINSTSLVLILQIGKARLLLPGDAEWGTWKRILNDDEARTLLRGATFFKVGHHGSHNATSKTLVEKVLPKQIPAMISTQQGPGKYRNNIPLIDLLGALHDHKIHFARSDSANEELPSGFEQDEAAKWIDLTLEC